MIQAFGSYYHPEHFVCATCQAPFKNGKYFEANNEPYCEDHYLLVSTERCQKCDQPITEDDLARFQEKPYHNSCLKCCICDVALAKAGQKMPKIFLRDGELYCKQDYLEMFCFRCTACAQFVVSHRITVNDEYYHPDCLKCSICSKQLPKYICLSSGKLRCDEHTENEEVNFKCDVCSKELEDK